MDTLMNTQLGPEPLDQLDWKTEINLGVINSKSQFALTTKSDDADVPYYLWDVRALGMQRTLEKVEHGLVDRLHGSCSNCGDDAP
jgi:hypothetical protein